MLPQIKKILYATDLKEKGSKNAFRMAVSLAQTNNAQLVVLHVMEPISTSMEGMLRNAMSENEIQQFKTRGQENLRKELVQRVEDFCVEECPNPDKTYPGVGRCRGSVDQRGWGRHGVVHVMPASGRR